MTWQVPRAHKHDLGPETRFAAVERTQRRGLGTGGELVLMTSKEAEALPSPRREETGNVGQNPLTEDILISSPFRPSEPPLKAKENGPSWLSNPG
jgi:hypothetical protein